MSTCYESILGNIVFLRSCAAYLLVNRTLISLDHPINFDVSYYLCCQTIAMARIKGTSTKPNATPQNIQTLKLTLLRRKSRFLRSIF